jgi:hypothetical protein
MTKEERRPSVSEGLTWMDGVLLGQHMPSDDLRLALN